MTNVEWGDLDDDEYPDVDDSGDDSDDESSETRPCPHCGAAIYEEAQQCPECGQYVIFDSRGLSDRPLWWTLLGLIGIVAVICGLVSWAL